MSAVTTIVGMKNVLYKTLLNGIIIRLYSNNHIPVIGDDINNYTEVVGGGYSEITLDAGEINNWIFSDSIPVTAIYNEFLTFNFSSITSFGIVYGYYLISVSDGVSADEELLCAQKFSQSFITAANRYINIKPHLALNNL